MILVAAAMTLLGGACFLVRAVWGPSLADRIIALDGLVVVSVTLIILRSIATDSDWFLDAALLVAFVGFVGTSAGARFVERRGG